MLSLGQAELQISPQLGQAELRSRISPRFGRGFSLRFRPLSHQHEMLQLAGTASERTDPDRILSAWDRLTYLTLLSLGQAELPNPPQPGTG